MARMSNLIRLIIVSFRRPGALSILLLLLLASRAFSQSKTDTAYRGRIVMERDSRVAILGDKMAEYNEALSKKTKLADGYRLMLLSTDDRKKAMDLKSRLLSSFPDQKVYTIFQSPNIKIKFGNFLDAEEAEKMKKQLQAMGLVQGNIYVLPEKVEVKGDKVRDDSQPEN